MFLLCHGDMFDGIPHIGWLTEYGRPKILPLTDLLDYLQVKNRGWAIEQCSVRMFFAITCSGGKFLHRVIGAVVCPKVEGLTEAQ